MDLWSFLRNEEVNAVILSRDFAEKMEAMFERDLSESKQILLEQWKKRSLTNRFMELFGRLISHWL
jgi:cardiolipin synthase